MWRIAVIVFLGGCSGTASSPHGVETETDAAKEQPQPVAPQVGATGPAPAPGAGPGQPRIEAELRIELGRLVLDGMPIAGLTIAEGRFHESELPDGEHGLWVPKISEALKQKAEQARRSGAAAFEGRVAILPDPALPSFTLFQVLYSCGNAGFEHTHFRLGQGAASEYVEIAQPKRPTRLVKQPLGPLDRAALLLAWTDGGLRAFAELFGSGTPGEEGPRGLVDAYSRKFHHLSALPAAARPFPLVVRSGECAAGTPQSMTELARAMCRVNGGQLLVSILPHDRTTVGEMLSLLTTIRAGVQCDHLELMFSRMGGEWECAQAVEPARVRERLQAP